MPTKKAEYDIKYAKEHLKRISVNYQKAEYEEVKAAADAAGAPVSTYIKESVRMRMDSERQ